MISGKEKFLDRAARFNRVPLYREIGGDFLNPVSALSGFMDRENVFLLESAFFNKKNPGYTFLGHSPESVLVYEKGLLKEKKNGEEKVLKINNPIEYLKSKIVKESDSYEEFGDFCGGYVGFLGYNMANYMGLLRKKVRESDSPSLVFFRVDDFYVFDNSTGKVYACSVTEPGIDPDAYEKAFQKTLLMASEIINCSESNRELKKDFEMSYDFDSEEYSNVVNAVKKDIRDGECIQTVISNCYTVSKKINPLTLYRVMRNVNPSPYMFFLKNNQMVLCGTSPETHLKVKNNIASLKPIAGTAAVEENCMEEISEKLLSDRKEKAEHLMLVDLARNDLNRGCKAGSVKVSTFFQTEVFSHVVHIVSEVKGEIRDDVTPFELFCSTFPAGTVTGAPRVRAMELIDEYEKSPRGWYAGCTGYFSYSGDIDTCITIRSACVFENRVELRAGAGIVNESDPDKEFREVHLKLSSLFESIDKIYSQEEEHVFNGG